MSANHRFEKELAIRECQRIVFEACEIRAGMRINEQIKSAARKLQQPYGRVRRAWFGLAGQYVLAELRQAMQRGPSPWLNTSRENAPSVPTGYSTTDSTPSTSPRFYSAPRRRSRIA